VINMHKTFHNLCTSKLGPKHVTEQELVREINTHKYRVIKVSVHLMITLQKPQKYFKQFQSLTMIMQLELGIAD
jgi:hypothetical protein